MMGKVKNCFDRSLADLNENDNVGSFLRSGVDGSLITSGNGASDNVANTFEGLDTRAFAYAWDSVGDNWDRLQINASGELKVAAAIDVANDFVYNEDTAHATGDAGAFGLTIRMADINGVNAALLAGTEGDYQGSYTNNKGELYVVDSAGNALLATIDSSLSAIDADTSNIASDTAAMVIDLAAIEVEQLAQGVTLDSILTDTNAMVVDLAAIEVEQLAQGVTLDSLLTEAQKANYIGNCLRTAETSQFLKSTQVNATITQGALIASALANRTGFYVQNCGNREVYVAEAGVIDAAAVGLKLPCGAIADFKFASSASVDIEAIGGTQDLRVMEYAC